MGYEQPQLTTEQFLSVTYKLMLRKVNRLKDIENSKKRNKLPLPILKEKLDIISNLLEALRVLMLTLDYDTEMGVILSDIFTDFSRQLTLANISEHEEASQRYDICIAILDGFLE